MKSTWIPPIIYKVLGLKNIAGNQINPATEETIDIIAQAVHNEDDAHVSGDKGVMMLAIRSDSDIATANDGDYTVLKLDEQGRLKVSSKPASYPDITGDITAIQATIGTPVVGGTVAGDVSCSSNLMIFCTGTFSGINCTFEGSLEATGDTNWFAVQAVRTNANTIELTTGALSAQPAYAWEASVNALKRFRVRCTARTSGTQSWRFVQGTYATEPIPASQVSGTQPVSGTVTANQGTAATISTANGSGAHFVRPGIVGITDIASAAITTTTTSASILADLGDSFQVSVQITAASGTNPTMDLRIEESFDGGTNWLPLYEFERVTGTRQMNSPVLQAASRHIRYVRTISGTTPSFTMSVIRTPLPFHNAGIHKRVFDRNINLNSLGSTTNIIFTGNAKNFQLALNLGTFASAPTVVLEGSDSNVFATDFYPLGAPLVGVASGITVLNVVDTPATYIRARVTVAGTSVVLGYLTLKAT